MAQPSRRATALFLLLGVVVVIVALVWSTGNGSRGSKAMAQGMSARALAKQAEVLDRRGDTSTAETLLEQALAQDPNIAETHLQLARLLRRAHHTLLHSEPIIAPLQRRVAVLVQRIMGHLQRAIQLYKAQLNDKTMALSPTTRADILETINDASALMADTYTLLDSVSYIGPDDTPVIKQLLNIKGFPEKYPALYVLLACDWFSGSIDLNSALTFVNTAIELGYLRGVDIKADILWDVASHVPSARVEMEAQRKQLLQWAIHRFVTAKSVAAKDRNTVQSWFTRLFHLYSYSGDRDQAIRISTECISTLGDASLCYQNRAYAYSMSISDAPLAVQDLRTSWEFAVQPWIHSRDSTCTAQQRQRSLAFDLFDDLTAHGKPDRDWSILHEPERPTWLTQTHVYWHSPHSSSTKRFHESPASMLYNDSIVYAATLHDAHFGEVGIYTPCKYYRIYSLLDRPKPRDLRDVLDVTVVEIDKAFHLHWATHAYYHWLVESLPRLLELTRVYGTEYRILARHSSFAEQSLTLLGIPHSRVVWLDHDNIYHITDLKVLDWRFAMRTDSDEVVIEPYPSPNHGVLSSFYTPRKLLLPLRERLLQAVPRSSAPRSLVIFITREEQLLRAITDPRGDLTRRLKQVAQQRGLELVPFEGTKRTMTEQIQLFGRARVIIGPHGAALANMLFAPTGTAVIEFPVRSDAHRYFEHMAGALGMPYYEVPEISAAYETAYEINSTEQLDAAAATLNLAIDQQDEATANLSGAATTTIE